MRTIRVCISKIIKFLLRVFIFVHCGAVCFILPPTGYSGAAAAIRKHQIFFTPEDTEHEESFFGPTGNGEQGKTVGCKHFFSQLDAEVDFSELSNHASAFQSYIMDNEEENLRLLTLLNRLCELASKFAGAFLNPE